MTVPLALSGSIVGPGHDSASVPPVCDCSRVVRLPDGREVPVRGRRWSCPSCGLDKRRQLIRMCERAGAAYLLTLTIAPELVDPLVPKPARHALCRQASHEYKYNGVWKWRVIPNCENCCRWRSNELAKWRKRMRRAFGAHVQVLYVFEETKTGLLHIHVAVTGLPAGIPNSLHNDHHPAIMALRALWPNGYIDLKGRRARTGGALGAYLGKYLTKQDCKMARGYRRWNRTAGFAPEVFMNQWAADQRAARKASEVPPEGTSADNQQNGQLGRASEVPPTLSDPYQRPSSSPP